MKKRSVVFAAGFLFGLLAGILLSQESVRVPLTSAITLTASNIDQHIREFIAKTRGSAHSTAENDSGPAIPAVPARPPPPEKTSYIREFIQLNSVKATTNPTTGNVAVISGRVKNSGDWDLIGVSVTVYFISEADIVFDTRLPIVGDTPLAGGAEIRFEVNVPNVPGSWSGGRVRTVVTDIEFAD